MIINVDEEAFGVIKSFCDLALKTGGLQSRNIVDQTLGCIKIIKDMETASENKNSPAEKFKQSGK